MKKVRRPVWRGSNFALARGNDPPLVTNSQQTACVKNLGVIFAPRCTQRERERTLTPGIFICIYVYNYIFFFSFSIFYLFFLLLLHPRDSFFLFFLYFRRIAIPAPQFCHIYIYIYSGFTSTCLDCQFRHIKLHGKVISSVTYLPYVFTGICFDHSCSCLPRLDPRVINGSPAAALWLPGTGSLIIHPRQYIYAPPFAPSKKEKNEIK